MLQAARIDPMGMVRFLDGLARGERPPRTVLKYLSTHPGTTDRVDRLRALAARTTAPPIALLPGSNWDDVKRICHVT